MEFTLNTSNVDVTVALNALKYYKARDYKGAMKCLLEILDVEPNNWDARLMLAACYYKTSQYASAQRAFRFLMDRCPDADLKGAAVEGLQAATAKLEANATDPIEFGAYAPRLPQSARPSWLD
jgi:tetratricopeptide (TPR) repeat protein